MAKQKSGGLKKRRRTPAESSAQRSRSYRNKQDKRAAHALKHPNDKKSLESAKRWTPASQSSQRVRVEVNLPKGN